MPVPPWVAARDTGPVGHVRSGGADKQVENGPNLGVLDLFLRDRTMCTGP
jgi:hypothetical protein